MSKPLLITDYVDENLKLVRDDDGTDTALQLSKDKLKVVGDLDISGNIKTTNQDEPVIDKHLATKKYVDDSTQYYYDIKYIGYNAGTATYAYLPINGYILEGTSTSGRNEYQSFVAPYSGRIHQLQWRTEEAVSALNSFRILESSDGTEVPGSVSYRKDIDVDIADDTTYNFDLSSPTTGSTGLIKGRIYVLYYSFGVDTNDTNFTVVFEWDLTT